MTRNLKVLMLAVVAIFAMSAMAAASASAAQSKFTSDGPATLDGVEDGENFLEYPGLGKVTCSGSTFTAHELGSTTNGIPNGATTATVTPHYNNSTCTENGGEHKMTVTMNGCHYVFHLVETTADGIHHKVLADVVCPGGGPIIVHVYFSGSNENLDICTLTIGAQNGIEGFDIANDPTNPEAITLTGEATNIAVSKHGICGAGSINNGRYKANVTLTGTDAAGNPTEIHVSD